MTSTPRGSSWSHSTRVCRFLIVLLATSLVAPGSVARGEPATLLTGVPTLPAVPGEDAADAPLRITVQVSGEDALRVFSDRLEWVHGSGLVPFQVVVNRFLWYPKRSMVLESIDGQSPLPEALNLETAEVRCDEGQAALPWTARKDHLEIHFSNDTGRFTKFVVSLRNGPEFPAVKQDPGALKKIVDSLAKSPRPIPAGERRSLQSDADSLAHEWRRSRLALAFDKQGKKDVAWTAAARDYLERVARVPAEPLDTLIAAGQAVIDAGCDDPLVCCEQGRLLLEKKQSGASESLLLHAVLAFEHSEYPRRCSRSAPALLAVAYRGQADGGKRGQVPGLIQRAILETAQATCESFAPGHQRAWFAELLNEIGDDPRNMLFGCRSRIAKAISNAPTADGWLTHMLVAAALTGPGAPRLQLDVLSAPPSDEAGELAPRLRLAREHLIEAWRLHPDFPEAATRLITLVWDLGNTVSETPRFWFDEAVAAQLDQLEAYERLLDTVRPEYGGEDDEMIVFGAECGATNRIDTGVPRMM